MPVELYVQNSKERFTTGAGVYSIVKDEWLKKPSRKEIVIDFGKVKDKTSEIMNTIEAAKTIEELEAIKNHPEYESADKLLQRIKLERAK